VEAAESALSQSALYRTRVHVALIRSERDVLRDRLIKVADVREVLPSQANFLAVRFNDAGARYRQLLARGIVVRDVRRYQGLEDALRVTVGSPDENAALLAVLARPVEEAA
jgi:histidinol-phosphate aminotransferase